MSSKQTPSAMDEPRLSQDDPVFQAVAGIVAALDGRDRLDQLRILAAVSVLIGDYARARELIYLAQRTDRERRRKETDDG